MDIIERFIRYVRIDTQSDPDSTLTPSTAKQLVLANILKKELEDLKASDIYLDDKGVLYARIEANIANADCIGFIAHIDTAPDMSGTNVRPQLLRNYKGSRVVINKELNMALDTDTFPSLKKAIGHDLILTDGTTLLGADDKAGVALIMDLVQTLKANPTIKHGPIAIAFTPDEEVGRGTENFDIARFNADYAYTVDGGDPDDIEYENFNAGCFDVLIKGLSIHPGSAKDKMINSQHIAMEFHSLLPKFLDPSCTSDYEGFNHLVSINGNVDSTKMHYIIRNHDLDKLKKQAQDFVKIKDFINDKYGQELVSLVYRDEYPNMRSIIEKDMRIVNRVKEKMQELGMNPSSTPIRGGTDGASLTYRGLPCPNLGTGGHNCHGPYEYLDINEMRQMQKLLLKIVEVI